MKKVHLLIAIIALICFGACNQKPETVIIEGKITNLSEPILYLPIQTDYSIYHIDTIRVEEDGSFYHETDKVTFPQKMSVSNRNIQYRDFFVAPGYHLTITGYGADFLTMIKSGKIEGAESNRYKMLYDSALVERMDMTRWYELKGDSLLRFIKDEKQLTDSLEKVVFEKRNSSDPYLPDFGRMIYLDNQFMRIYYILTGQSIGLISEEQADSFMTEVADKNILDDLFNDDYLISESFKVWFLSQYFANFIKEDVQNDSTLKDTREYRLEKVNNTFDGKIRDLMLYKQLETLMAINILSLEQLEENKSLFDKYLAEINNPEYQQALQKMFNEKEALLNKTQIGNEAPNFTLNNEKGEPYSLTDFRGKVVYLDLWASWCGPCRQQVPALKELHEKYKDSDEFMIVGVAVHDKPNEWKKALEEDKPEWLQLIDENGDVARTYEANFIPRYILIDKNGNIADLNAPSPSNIEELENKITEAMSN